jgi:hypothetical protein
MALNKMGIFQHLGEKKRLLTRGIFKQPIVRYLKKIAFLKAQSLLVNIEI